jgi:hypothetical protein
MSNHVELSFKNILFVPFDALLMPVFYITVLQLNRGIEYSR